MKSKSRTKSMTKSKKQELDGGPDTSIHSNEDSINVSEISDYPVEIDEQ